jgi:hypothetical protein
MGVQQLLRLAVARAFELELVVVALLFLGLTGRIPRLVALPVAVAVGAIAAMALASLVRARGRRLRQAAAMPTLGGHAVPDPDPPPFEVQELIDALVREGFSPAGVMDAERPDRGDFRVWALVEPGGATWVEVGGLTRPTVMAIASFLSQTAGGRVVETGWPRGSRIDLPQLLAVPGSPTLPLTLEDHRARVAAERRADASMRVSPADPAWPDGWRVRTFDDYVAWTAVERRLVGGLTLRESVRVRIMPALWTALILTIVAVVASVALLAVPESKAA